MVLSMSGNGIEVKIPNVGESIRDVQIGKWLKHEGDHVERDETIVELETDKASMDLPAPSRGVIAKIFKQEGELVAVGEVIARLEASDTPEENAPEGHAPVENSPLRTPNEVPAAAKKQPAPAREEKTAGQRDDVRDDAREKATARPAGGTQPTPAAPPTGPLTGRPSESAAAPTSPLSAPAQAVGPVKPPYESRSAETADRPAQTADRPAQPPDRSQPRPDSGAQPEEPAASPSVRRMLREHHLRPGDVKPTAEGGRLVRDDVVRYVEEQEKRRPPEAPDGTKREAQQPSSAAPASAGAFAPQTVAAGTSRQQSFEGDSETIVPMSLIRRRIAERLVEARQKAALLTTFNEIDMSAVIDLRTSYREAFQQKYGVKLGFLSFFVKAAVEALRQVPAVNAEVRGSEIVYHNRCHVGIAIGAKRGLVVPVLRDADRLTFAEIEQAIDDFAERADANKLEPGELSGGTFTISNGGIYGSLLSTPIVNPPQSGVLGLHAIQQRPIARGDQVIIRPMMYVALTYDHRLIDGREAVTFLRAIKETVETPARLLIGI